MYNLALHIKRVAALHMQEFVWVVKEEGECPNAVWQKGVVQSVREDILEPLMAFSAAQGGKVTQQRIGPDCLKFYTNDTYLNKIIKYPSGSFYPLLSRGLQKWEKYY